MVKKLISAMVAIVIGLALLPVVADFTAELAGDAGTYTGTTLGSLIDLLPILYVIILVAGAVGWVVVSSKN